MKQLTMATVVALLVGLLISLAMAEIGLSNVSSFSSNSSNCIESEKYALLIFKQHLIDPINRLVSWTSDAEDCCRWVGVVCDNRTGHVLELRLGVPQYEWDGGADYDSYKRMKLKGKIHPCLSNLKHLRHLDLHNNLFQGMLPYQLGNLSNLQTLNLGGDAYFPGLLYVNNLQWLSGLSLLKHLDLSMVNLKRALNWLHVVNSLPFLEELNLSVCELSLVPPFPYPKVNNFSFLTVLDLSGNKLGNDQLDFGWVSNLHSLTFLNLEANNFDGAIPDVLRNLRTSLRQLDLSHNNFNSSIPHWIYTLSDLEVLSIGDNLLQGEISSDIGNMTSLNELDLSYNQLEGKLPTSIGSLCNLRSISLSDQKLNQSVSQIFEILSRCSAHKLESLWMNRCHLFGVLTDQLAYFKNLREVTLSNNAISGPLPTSIGQLANLEYVEIENNLLEGVVSELHFAHHTKLKYFVASGNSLLILNVHPNWVPPFQLIDLHLESWHIGPSIPPWLRSQKSLVFLDISNSKISDSIPRWFWGLTTHMVHLNLSHNQIYGQFESLPNISELDFSFNCFSGPLPRLSVAFNNELVDFSSNNFWGSLSRILCYRLNHTNMRTKYLILSKNLLFGEIPECWIKWPELRVLKLDDNRFTGRIPTSMGTLGKLQSLNLYRNNLHGEIPLSLKSCRELKSIELGENKLDGHIPRWLGHSFPNLLILNLRSNRLLGNIPDGLCGLRTLQILDLANNTFSGSIPRCIYNFSVMVERNNGSKISSDIEYANFTLWALPFETATVIMKGQSLEYGHTLNLVRAMDFSCNNLSGEIPQEVTRLQALLSLNLSHNNLSGKIPGNIGAMQSLLSLDLSLNQLSGSIPPSMSSITFLSHLNLSHNNLTGEIPSSTQLQSFNASSYIGNHLCGPPLEDCIESGIKPNGTRNEDNISTHAKRFKVKGLGLYISMALGFIVGFWSIVAPLVISRRWRFTYYGFLEQMWWRLYDFLSKFYCHL